VENGGSVYVKNWRFSSVVEPNVDFAENFSEDALQGEDSEYERKKYKSNLWSKAFAV